MFSDPQKHHRRSLRLKGYSYSQAGTYFVTVCVQDRACLFGEVASDQMHLNDAGRIILSEWNALPTRFPMVGLDTVGIMPNHIHSIIVLAPDCPSANTNIKENVDGIETVGAGLVPAPSVEAVARPEATTRVAPTPALKPTRIPTLGDIVGAFKSLTTDLYIHGVKQSGWPGFRKRLWQRNYHEHIIRNDESLQRIRRYILDNPTDWASDPENPQASKKV